MGRGQPSVFEPLEESLLEAAEGDGSVAVHDRTELRGAGLPAEQFLNLRRRRAVANPGLVAGPGEVIDGEGGGQVDEGLGDGGDRDASPERCFAFAAVHGEALHPPVRRGRDLGRGRRSLDDRPKVRR